MGSLPQTVLRETPGTPIGLDVVARQDDGEFSEQTPAKTSPGRGKMSRKRQKGEHGPLCMDSFVGKSFPMACRENPFTAPPVKVHLSRPAGRDKCEKTIIFPLNMPKANAEGIFDGCFVPDRDIYLK